jgi:hypothetical protein
MKTYLVTLKPAPNDHKIGRAQLSATLDKMGISHNIKEFWYFGRHRAVIEMHPSSAKKVESSGLAESVCFA